MNEKNVTILINPNDITLNVISSLMNINNVEINEIERMQGKLLIEFYVADAKHMNSIICDMITTLRMFLFEFKIMID
jgi:hypothetical protein